MVFDTWDSYFAEPHGTVLRNLYGYGELEGSKLAEAEYRETALRQADVLSGRAQVPQTFDADHVRGIHRHLFGNVYEWAGEYRTVNLMKQGKGFARTGDIDTYLKHARRIVDGTDWPNADHTTFATQAAKVFSLVNQAHPFREGNGRTAKVYMLQLAERSPFAIEYDRISPERWNEASRKATPAIDQAVPEWQHLVPVWEAITVPRTASAAPAAVAAAPSLTSYPQATRTALNGAAAQSVSPKPHGHGYTAAARQNGYER